MREIINDLSHIGDIIAIPFFALLVIYLYDIENKNLFEYALLFFGICGFLLDALFTYIYLSNSKLSQNVILNQNNK